MKRILTLAIISILFISMFVTMVPKVKAQDTNYFFRFQGTFSGSINDGVFDITSGTVTADSSTYTIVNAPPSGYSGSEINKLITQSGELYMENIIALSDGIVGQFDPNTSNYTVSRTSTYYSALLLTTLSSLSFWNCSSGEVLSNTTGYANLETIGSSFTLSGSNVEPSNFNQSSYSDSSQSSYSSNSTFVRNFVGLIEGTLAFANAILANYVTPGNSTSPATLTPAGTTFVNSIAGTINNIIKTASDFFYSLAHSTSLSTNLLPNSSN